MIPQGPPGFKSIEDYHEYNYLTKDIPFLKQLQPKQPAVEIDELDCNMSTYDDPNQYADPISPMDMNFS